MLGRLELMGAGGSGSVGEGARGLLLFVEIDDDDPRTLLEGEEEEEERALGPELPLPALLLESEGRESDTEEARIESLEGLKEGFERDDEEMLLLDSGCAWFRDVAEKFVDPGSLTKSAAMAGGQGER